MAETSTPTDLVALKEKIKHLLVDRLKLDIEVEAIGDEDLLFGEALGLDSIDALELVLGVEQEFGVKIEDDEMGQEVLATVSSLAGFVSGKQGAD